jgi:hypothetical protein
MELFLINYPKEQMFTTGFSVRIYGIDITHCNIWTSYTHRMVQIQEVGEYNLSKYYNVLMIL